jgi:D-alanyl-D-alanine carboxypeptidase (penicillin-binding protein 5/6)
MGVFFCLRVHPALATVHRRHHHRAASGVYHPVPLYHAELLMDADSGNVLYADNDKLQWPPASMAKMMLLAVAEDQIKAGRVHYGDAVTISESAATTGGSRLGLREGQVYPLDELMKAALIRSANDAAVAVAERVAGSVENCVRLMNAKARSLGMDDTVYNTVNGLPPHPGHDVDFTTAHDLATLARSIILHTRLLRWSGLEETPFDGGRIMLHNTNHLIGHMEGCDGLKTGFTFQAGFNLTATAIRGDMRLISVVLGAPSNPERFIQSERLLDWGFDNYTKVHVVTRGQALPVQVQVVSGPMIQPVAEDDFALVLPKNQTSDVKVEYTVPPVVQGPVASGQLLGQVVVRKGADVMTRVDAVCPGPGTQPAPVVSAATVATVDDHIPTATSLRPAQSAPEPINNTSSLPED